jgi:peptidyl-prolyl cis-trans isomerase B (cyclophilin B)
MSEVFHPKFTILLENGGEIRGELYPEYAPQTVGNFSALANSGFYDSLTFHRVIPNFMIQGGCPRGNGTGNPGYSIKGEFANNGIPNPIKHTYGVISMARSMLPDSAGSQFFIMVAAAPHLDGNYAAFGKVLEGMEYVEKIVMLPRDANDKPLTPAVIKSIRVDTEGHNYPFDQY